MAAETVVAQPAQETTSKGGRSKLLVVGLVLAVAVGAAYFLLMAKPAPPADGEPVAPETTAPIEDGAVLEVATLTVNLDSEDLRYARVQFGVVTAMAAPDPSARFPLLQDRAISTIAAFTPTQLRTVEGHQQLRARLTEDALAIWPDGEVLRVVLYDLIVQ